VLEFGVLRNRSQFLLLLFFISGVCGLIYEVIWTRLFIVVIGNTVFSVSAVLTVFMAGLAAGSRLAGKVIDRKPVRLVRTYALLEAGIGVYNLLLPLLLMLANPLFGALYESAFNSFFILTLGRLLIVLLLLIIPATLMGATLPILIRFYVENIATVGTQAGRVYTANTWGAAVGTAAAGFLLIPYFGVNVSLYLTVALSLAIAAIAWLFSRTQDTIATSFEVDSERPGPRVVLIAMMLSGFAALIDEVAWTRVLSLVVGPTTYAFTLMLTSMITGLGLGAALGSRLARKRNISLSTFAWIELIVAATSLAVIPLLGRMPVWIGTIVTKYVEQFGVIQMVEFSIFFGLMLIPTTFLGMTFPIASRLYAKSNSLLGTEVSAIYGFNTIGGILGSLAAGFLLIPLIGSQWALIVASFINAGAALVLAPPPRQWMPAIAAILVLSASFLIPRWDPELMSSGAYKYAPYYKAQADLESMLKSGDLAYFKEGATTTVSVRRHRGETSLAIDGKVDATDSGDMTTQKMLGHLPLLLSDAAKHVAIIGLGSGVTAGAALRYPIESLDVVEISPEVAAASDFFKHVNHDALRDTRTRLIIGDGRNHLRYIRKKYDVIISEPSNPWMSGMASLFSREFFQEALSRLSENGIHCQWFHSYNMSTDDLRTVIATFRTVFPHAQLWALNQNDFLLLGSPARIEVSENSLKRNFQHVTADLEPIGIRDVFSIASLYLLEDEDLDAFASGASLNTDSHPVLEFHAPRFIYANTTDQNYAAISAVQKKVTPPAYISQLAASVTAENLRNKGEMYLTSDSYKDAAREFRNAIELNVTDEVAWNGLLKTTQSASERPEVAAFIERILSVHRLPIVRLSAAEFYSQEANYGKGIPLVEAVLSEDPQNRVALEKLIEMYVESGSMELPATVDRLLAIDPENPKGLYSQATIRLYQQRFDEAIQLVKRSITRDPSNVRARDLLAIAYGQTFQHDLADAEFRKTIKEFPYDWLTLNNYGLYLLDRGRFSEAMNQFRTAVDLNPEDVQAFVGLGEACRQSGRPEEADRWYRIALRLDPNQSVAKQYVR
jgi:spermidine synthase